VPEAILIGTGSEVQLAVAAREILEAAGVATRVESMPSQEWFAEQTAAYRERVLPRGVRAAVSVDLGWIPRTHPPMLRLNHTNPPSLQDPTFNSSDKGDGEACSGHVASVPTAYSAVVIPASAAAGMAR
jgi:hypothetical protein